MPDFDTRTPQGPNEPSRHRIASIAEKLRALLVATGPRLLAASAHRIESVANALRRYVIADWFRSALIGGILFALIAIPVGVRSYSPRDLAESCEGQDASQRQGSGPVLASDGQWTQGRWIDSSEASDPLLSPDGEWILYLKTEVARASGAPSSATPEQRPYPFVMKADGSCRYKLLDSVAYHTIWSPDSEKIAFVAPSGNRDEYSIFVINADGSGGARRITAPASDPPTPDWSPDGEILVYGD